MPKMKTSRSAAKRFKVTGTGKLKRAKAYKSQGIASYKNSMNSHNSSCQHSGLQTSTYANQIKIQQIN